jgi:hypothetical protein
MGVLGVGAGLIAGPSPASAAITEDEARAEFQVLCESLQHGDNRFFSDRPATELEAALPTVAGDPVKEAEVLGLLAREKLKLADPPRAIELFEQSLRKIAGREQEAPAGMVATFEWSQALAWLGYAEDQNCIAHNGGRSCILPVKGSGVHSMPEAARKAGDLFLAYARKYPDAPNHVQAKWLLNVARQVSGDWPDGTFRSGPTALPSSVSRW